MNNYGEVLGANTVANFVFTLLDHHVPGDISKNCYA